VKIEELVQLLTGAGAGVAALIFGLWWLDRDRRLILTSLEKEREGRITHIEEQNRLCAEDRVNLREKIDELQTEFRSLEKDIREKFYDFFKK